MQISVGPLGEAGVDAGSAVLACSDVYGRIVLSRLADEIGGLLHGEELKAQLGGRTADS